MQEVIVDIVALGLMVFLFVVISWARSDDRLRCWAAGWLCILGHFIVELPKPTTVIWQHVQTFANIGTLAIAVVFFIVSTTILVDGRKAGIRLWTTISLTTLTCFGLVAFGVTNVWVLSAALGIRQGLAVLMAARDRCNRRTVAPIAFLLCLSAAAWGLFGIFHGQPELVFTALLTELYLVAAVDFWSNGWEHTIALHSIAGGLVAWAAVFPVGYLMWLHWPNLEIDGDIWNVPKLCVSAGMILLVLEDDSRATREMSKDYRLLFEGNPHPLWIFELKTLQFLAANQATLDLHGYTREEFLRLKLTDILDPSDIPAMLQQVRSAEPSPNKASKHLRKDGTFLPMDVEARNIVFQGKKCRFVLGLDVTERDGLERQLVSQAQHDALTGLLNRKLFEEQLTEAVNYSIQSREKLALLCLDICRFKRINDVYGPRIGDMCMQHVARILGSGLSAVDLLARTGGDEFSLVLTGIRNMAAAEQMAADLQERFRRPVLIQGYNIELSISMGLAICPDDGTNAIALWRGAESMLRRAQAAGGGQALWLSPELREDAEEQIEIESAMRMNMEESGFSLAYQPIYGFDGQIHGLEALLRLNHPRYGAVSPAKVIPIAEETGLIVPLGQWIIEQVCQQLHVWMDQETRLVPVAVNVSSLQLMHVDFADRLMETLLRYAIDPKWIHLEVTETAAMCNLKEVSGQMATLSALGISFSIDDFGTGHSSLERLHQLPISVLKIDRSFIVQLCGQDDLHTTMTIVQAVVSMAHALGQQVVAEGVETLDQLACLRGLQCDLLQGYLFSRPVSPQAIPALLATVNPALALAPLIEACAPQPLAAELL